jgi:peptidoglycan hydrolase CwlO-like protein
MLATLGTPTIVAASLTVVAAALATLGTYMVARRRTSGQIATSDAATLWKESQQMRKELRDEVLVLRVEVLGLRTEIKELKAEIHRLNERLALAERKAENE